MDIITEKFLNYLNDNGVSKITLKNYKSDIKNFVDWFSSKLSEYGTNAENLSECLPFIKPNTIALFKSHLEEIQTPKSTINRRLSTLRNLGTFLYDSGITNKNVSENLSNITKEDEKSEKEMAIEGFAAYMRASNTSKNTIKNYLADIRQFLDWTSVEHPNLK